VPRGLFLDVLHTMLVPSLAPTGSLLVIQRRLFDNRIKRDSQSVWAYTREKKVFRHLNMLKEVNSLLENVATFSPNACISLR